MRKLPCKYGKLDSPAVPIWDWFSNTKDDGGTIDNRNAMDMPHVLLIMRNYLSFCHKEQATSSIVVTV